MRVTVVCMCLQLFYEHVLLFSLPITFFGRCTYLCASVFINLFCIVYKHCTSMRVQNASAAAQQNPGIPVGRG